MPDPTHFSPNSPAGQAPTPDRRRHAHSASLKVLSPSTSLGTFGEVEGLRDPIQSSWTSGQVGRTVPSRSARGMNDASPGAASTGIGR